MRIPVVLATLLGLCLAPQAEAAPAGGFEDAAGVQFVVRTAAGQERLVRLLATRPTGAGTTTAPRLLVHVMDPNLRSSGTLAASSFTVSDERATLRTTLAGRPLTVTWSGETYTRAVGFGELISDPDGARGYLVTGTGGSAQVRFGDLRCTSDSVVLGSAVTYAEGEYGGPLAQPLGIDLKGARCSAPVVTSLPPLP